MNIFMYGTLCLGQLPSGRHSETIYCNGIVRAMTLSIQILPKRPEKELEA